MANCSSLVPEASPSAEPFNVSITIPADKDKSNSQQRGQWLRAAVLGANDGLLTTASLMLGVGAAEPNKKTVAVSGFGALVAGACSMAIGEFVSVNAQRDAQAYDMKIKASNLRNPIDDGSEDESLPNPFQAAMASALAFCAGGIMPLLSGAFISNDVIRDIVLASVSSVALAAFGAVGAYYGRSAVVKGTLRVLIGGWMAMSVTYGLVKIFGKTEG